MLVCAVPSIAACDLGPGQDESWQGPDLHVIASRPAPGEGFDCDPAEPTCGVPVDAALRFRFDRHLHPATAVRQSVKLYAGSDDPDRTVFLEPAYEVIERVLSFSVPSGFLLPGVVYTVELPRPTESQDFGFRAYDGAPIAATTHPLAWSFRTRSDGLGGGGSAPAQPASCRAALGVLATSCGQTDCHAACQSGPCARQPRMGLELDSPQGVTETAVWKLARETITGQDEATPLRNPPRFGAQMPIVEPGRPENSYLVYKLLASVENYRDASGASCHSRYFGQLPSNQCLAPSEAEQERLRAWLPLLSPMPPAVLPLDAASPLQALRGIVDWIAEGAATSNCGDD